MADPTKYVPSYDFSAYQASSPADPLPGDRVDTENADIAASISEIVDAVKDVRRSDGALKNGVVSYESLSERVKAIIGADVVASAATSTTSNVIGTGTKTFTVEAGKIFDVGLPVTVVDSAAPTVNALAGSVVSYSGTTLVVLVTGFIGSGTISSWYVYASGLQGLPGPAGAPGAGTGDMVRANNLSDLTNVGTARGNLGLGSYAVLNVLPDGAVYSSAQMSDGVVTTAKHADSSVTTAKIADGNVTTSKIADANITAAKMANAAVDLSGSVVTGVAPIAKGGTGFNALETTVASASTVDLGAQLAPVVNITGTTTITAFGTATAGTRRTVRFGGVLTLTHNATSLILPGNASITTAAGDCCIAHSLGSGNWRVDAYEVAAGAAPAGVSSVTGSGGITVSPTTGTPVVTVNTNNSGGVGAIAMLNYNASSVANGSTASSSLYYITFEYDGSGNVTAPGAVNNSASGTWRNISGRTLGTTQDSQIGLFIRVS